MDTDRDEPGQPDGRFGSLFGIGIDQGFPPIIRVWHRLMMTTVVVFAVLAAGTLFGIFPDSWHRLFGIFGLATMLLLVPWLGLPCALATGVRLPAHLRAEPTAGIHRQPRCRYHSHLRGRAADGGRKPRQQESL